MNDYLNRMGRPAQVANGGGPEAPAQHPAVGGPNKKRKIMPAKACIIFPLFITVPHVFKE